MFNPTTAVLLALVNDFKHILLESKNLSGHKLSSLKLCEVTILSICSSLLDCMLVPYT